MTTTGTATLIADYGRSRGTAGDQRLYRLDPPASYERFDFDTDEYTTEPVEYVIVSASDVPYSGPETYLFAADGSGEVTHWGELPGSSRGDLDHEAALRRAGYVVAHDNTVRDTTTLIHRESVGAECLVSSAVTQWEQGAPVARFLESLGVTPESTRSTRLGRVEVEIADRDDFDRVRRNAVSEHAATEHLEPGFSYVEARIECVPVQFWSGVEL